MKDVRGNPVLEGKDASAAIRRRSIAGGAKIPNAAIFIKRTALEFLKILFSTRAEGSLRYDPEDTRTDIQISDLHAVDLSVVNRRPAIVAVRGPLTWQGLGLGSVESRDIKTGATTMNDLLTGSVAFSCISREGVEAEQIGHLVFDAFKFFRPTLQQYGFFSIKSLNLGPEQLIEQEGPNDKTTVVSVYVTAQIQERAVLSERVGRTLREIVITTLTNP